MQFLTFTPCFVLFAMHLNMVSLLFNLLFNTFSTYIVLYTSLLSHWYCTYRTESVGPPSSRSAGYGRPGPATRGTLHGSLGFILHLILNRCNLYKVNIGLLPLLSPLHLLTAKLLPRVAISQWPCIMAARPRLLLNQGACAPDFLSHPSMGLLP